MQLTPFLKPGMRKQYSELPYMQNLVWEILSLFRLLPILNGEKMGL
jgi:hypothetical protein